MLRNPKEISEKDQKSLQSFCYHRNLESDEYFFRALLSTKSEIFTPTFLPLQGGVWFLVLGICNLLSGSIYEKR
jgi:hypothetical protein